MNENSRKTDIKVKRTPAFTHMHPSAVIEPHFETDVLTPGICRLWVVFSSIHWFAEVVPLFSVKIIKQKN